MINSLFFEKVQIIVIIIMVILIKKHYNIKVCSENPLFDAEWIRQNKSYIIDHT